MKIKLTKKQLYNIITEEIEAYKKEINELKNPEPIANQFASFFVESLSINDKQKQREVFKEVYSFLKKYSENK
jgi:hypothetical protein